ncbi:MAG: U32 family peptidase [Clostridia bacterium]|nr:U32 family peptidase [Clostridia bacterium]
MIKPSFSRPEILSPAGNYEKMLAAIRFGADAVYLAGHEFGMRSAADNFSLDELREAAKYVHTRQKKLFLTVNTLPHGGEYPRLAEYFRALSRFDPDSRIDAFIAADLGVISLLREIIPDACIHISTQASICSPRAALAYTALGASRLVLARELTLDEIRAIRAALPDEIEIEAFVHGSMCVSYSGRCMLSNMLTGRDANKGACAQPCRWNYTLYEEKRPDFPIPIEENSLGTFIMSSKDMCLIEHIGKLAAAGISSFKIEGRMKSAYYTAVVTNAYRMAVDACADFAASGGDPEEYKVDPALMRELCSVSHREYCTGFYFGAPAVDPQLVTRPGYVREKAYLAVAAADGEPLPKGIEAQNANGRIYRFTQRNKMCLGDTAELLSPHNVGRAFSITELYDSDGIPIDSTPHPSMTYYTRVPFTVTEGDIIRAGE